MFCKKDILKHFAKFTRKHLCERLFFNKIAVLKPATFKERDFGTGVFLWILQLFKNNFFYITLLPNGHIFADSPSNWRRKTTWKVRGNYIDFEWRIHMEIMTSIRRGYFNVDSTFKFDEISMSSPRGESTWITSKGCKFCSRYFHSVIL